jgi:hypothetical protein
MSEVLDGEAVIVDLRSGRYHAAQGVAATVWLTLRTSADLATLVGAVTKAHTSVPPDAESRIRAFVDQLLVAELIVEASGSEIAPQIESATTGELLPWNDPVLESHNDLEDLLLLDPVHDVGADGWPQVAPSQVAPPQ